MESEDASKMTLFRGTVSSASAPDNGPWRGSSWRMLQVTWPKSEVLQNAERVNPWQVEHVPLTKNFTDSYGSEVVRQEAEYSLDVAVSNM
ncbi:hypothetical protein L6164_016128 [Bauhinia variegata]|uniref:Uncharacterized protein n=1 Tax=Bauhinia variegata TaxID=167791 RepID=A0ACB9NP24_BAUVA|nr:hypothetical protein L6164_016128 [Bauhinia variegata]